jgi:ribonuclease P protein component
MTVFYLARQASAKAAVPGLRVGFTVGRALGGAVERNRMKRRLREAVRLTRPVPGPSADVVINPKKVILSAGFEAVLNEVRQAFVVLEKKLSGKAREETAVDPKSSRDRTPGTGS